MLRLYRVEASRIRSLPTIRHEIVDIQYGEGDHLKSAEVGKGMIQAHPTSSNLYFQ